MEFKVMYDDNLDLGVDIDTYNSKAEAESDIECQIVSVFEYFTERNIVAERKDYVDDKGRNVTEVTTENDGWSKWIREY